MKRITFLVDADLIDRARQIAKSERETLNAAFLKWLESYARRKGDVEAHRALMRRLSHINAGGPCRRDEMNDQ
jgi:hypothetical protein